MLVVNRRLVMVCHDGVSVGGIHTSGDDHTGDDEESNTSEMYLALQVCVWRLLTSQVLRRFRWRADLALV